MERGFEKEEILEALKEAEGDKAPRLDGLTKAFFKNYWSVSESKIICCTQHICRVHHIPALLEGDVMAFLWIFIDSAFLKSLSMPLFYI